MNKLISYLTIVLILSLTNTGVLRALTDEQRKIISSGAYYFNTEANLCEKNFISSVADGTLEDFVSKYGQVAFDTGKDYGIPYETILAQGALESAWGTSGLSANANNFHGLKAGSSWEGPVYHADTWEEINGVNVTVEGEAWRSFPDPEAGFRGYGDFITGFSRYAEALNYPGDPVAYLQAIKDAGYATDSSYVSKVSSVIERFEEYIADNNLFPPSSEVSHALSPPSPATYNNNCNPSDNTGVIEIAEAEYAKNPIEYDSNVHKYTLGRNEAWCADFVSWVFNEAGKPFSGGWAEDWQIPAVINMQAWFKNGTNGSEYFDVGTKPPQPGDVAFYIGQQTPDGGSTSHVNIVIEVNASDNTMITIGGNESDTVKRSQRQISLGSASLVGFGRMK